MNIVWFKRDLRILDHQPLTEAVKFGEVLPLYVVEPSLWGAGDLSRRHYQFVLESLQELKEEMLHRGATLLSVIGEMEEVLEQLHATYGFFRLFCIHESETTWSKNRMERVRNWMSEHQLPLHVYDELDYSGKTKSEIKKNWEKYIHGAEWEAPNHIPLAENIPKGFSPALTKLQLFSVQGDTIRFGQVGGESMGAETMQSFVEGRCEQYQEHYRKPLQASFSSSRISSYLAWGNISLRSSVRIVEKAMAEAPFEHKQQLILFQKKLYANFVAKHAFENHPGMDEKSIDPISDGFRVADGQRLKQLQLGMTGIPIIDAAMRCLLKTGWLPFEMRSLIVAFACNTLLLEWQAVSQMLSGLFLDYDPGIHFYQMQYFSGTSSEKSFKVINAIALGKTIDPEGAFIKRYVSELKDVAKEYIHEPWLFAGFYSLDYNAPMVDMIKTNKTVKRMLEPIIRSNQSAVKKDTDKQNVGADHQLSFDLFSEQ
ncbi:MAG: FAD-binding domain-containing protein [Bacillota bacterium]|nr:FAD-binding domain-containing protein [Bacillota bacterium]